MIYNTNQVNTITKVIKQYVDDINDKTINDMLENNPDWNQNDESAPDYIKNRPFYDETESGGELKLLDEKYVSYKPGLRVGGKTYTIDGQQVIANANAEIFNDYENNIATGAKSHAEGNYTKATGRISHAEGNCTVASGECSHAEGERSVASGWYAHAEGKQTTASGLYTHTEGSQTIASGHCSHAEGLGTIAVTQEQHVQGSYNVEDTGRKYAHIVGNGDSDTNRSNAHTLDWDGNAWYQGDIYVGGKSQDVGQKLATEEYVNNHSRNIFTITITGNETDGYTSDKTFTEVGEAYESGKNVRAIFEQNILPLVQYDALHAASFASVVDTSEYAVYARAIYMFNDNTIHYENIGNNFETNCLNYPIDVEALSTDNKTIIGALNELDEKIDNMDIGDNSEMLDRITTMEGQIADLLYTPISIKSFTNNIGTVELGRTITTVNFSWELNKKPTSLELDGVAQPISDRLSMGTALEGFNITSNTSWELIATDERDAVDKKSTSITFLNGIYYGVSTLPSEYNDDFIKGLATKTLSNTKGRTFTVTAGTDQYIYYAIPARLGECSFKVNGFDGGFENIGTVNFTNDYDYAENYYVYKSANANLGSTTVTVS